MATPKLRLKNYLTEAPTDTRGSNVNLPFGSEPIADFFPHTTVLFADLSGFTAWSSTREPSQVFTLLETLYGAMDKAARKLGVFKVETVGDCYVAATGLPDPRDGACANFVLDALSNRTDSFLFRPFSNLNLALFFLPSQIMPS
jgi:class 3 adenylate cyclase